MTYKIPKEEKLEPSENIGLIEQKGRLAEINAKIKAYDQEIDKEEEEKILPDTDKAYELQDKVEELEEEKQDVEEDVKFWEEGKDFFKDKEKAHPITITDDYTGAEEI
jgi:hypothetical protein